MLAASTLATPVTPDQAIAAVYAPVDQARAVWRGLVLVGHRRSLEVGHMFWALPGRGFADGVTLRQYDPQFRVICEPTKQQLIDMGFPQ
jgi:hypothetical protein